MMGRWDITPNVRQDGMEESAPMVRIDASGWPVRWDEVKAARYRAEGHWRGRTMAEAAKELVRADPDRILVLESGRSIAAMDLYSRAQQLANALIVKGLVPGDRISYQLPNWHEAILIDLAAAMAGLVTHPLVPIYREAEVSFMMNDCGSKVIFIPAAFRNHDYRGMMRRVLPKLSIRPEIVVLRGEKEEFSSFDSVIAVGDRAAALPVVDPDSVKLILYTSGTTGRPKGVLHTHNTVEAVGHQFIENFAIESNDSVLVASPVTHLTGAIPAFMTPWLLGSRAVMMDIWNAATAAELIDRHSITVSAGATPFLRELLASSREMGTRLESLKAFACGGASVPPDLIHQAHEWMANTAFVRAFGSSEVPTASVGIVKREAIELNATTDGRPVHSDVKIVNAATGGAIPWGDEGEILMRGPQMLLGYLREEDNLDAFDEEGYFRSGDLGRYVHDDWLVISGRKKDLINRAGEKLSAKEIEDALFKHPAIAEVAVVSVPNTRTGEGVGAYIVLNDGYMLDMSHVSDFLREAGLAMQKIPEVVRFVSELPKTASGKIQKHILRLRAAQPE